MSWLGKGSLKKNIVLGLFIALVLFINTFLEKQKEMEAKQNIKIEVWRTLFDIDWKKSKDSLAFPQPIFSKQVKELQGKKVRLSGYLIPNEISKNTESFLILSAYPASQCYFCGGAGLESVIEVHLEKPQKIITAKKITFEGKFFLNTQDSTHLFYQLKDAKHLKN